MERAQHRRKRAVVAVGRLDEYLSLLELPRLAFEFFQRRNELGRCYREVAVKREALAVQTRSRERQQNRGGSAQRNDAHAPLVRESHQACARIGNRGQSGLGEQAGIDRKSTRLNSSHPSISYAVFCLKKK